MGYVGLTFAIALTSKKVHVVGLEVDEEKIQLIRQGKLPFFEVGMQEILEKAISGGFLKVTSSSKELESASHCFITVGTPLVDGVNDTSQIVKVVNSIAPNLHKDSIICLRSTVALGTTRVIKKLLEQLGHTGRIAFCPERTIEGNALAELSQLPQIIGTDDSVTAKLCEQVFEKLNVKSLITDNFETAELAKLSCNAWRDLYFAFANEIALIGEDKKINAIEALRIAQLDYPRFQSALPGPVGGPCLVKDGKTLANSSTRRSTVGSLFDTARSINQEVIKWAIEKMEFVKSDLDINKMGLLGVSFKSFPKTDDMRNSPSLDLIAQASEKWPNLIITAWDPTVEYKHFKAIVDNDKILFDNELNKTLQTNTMIILCHKLMQEHLVSVKKYLTSSDGKVIIDLNNNFDFKELRRHTFFSFGLGI